LLLLGAVTGGQPREVVALKKKKLAAKKRLGTFDEEPLQNLAGVLGTVKRFKSQETLFLQGDECKNVMCIQSGNVKTSVLSRNGKVAVIAILGAGDFVGEGGLAGQHRQVTTATALTPVTVLTIDTEKFRTVLNRRPLSGRFLDYLLERHVRLEADLIDQLFNSSEKRLARTLLLLARYGMQDAPQSVLPKISQKTLAEMVGTTRGRINVFMNRFRKMGFIEYRDGLRINASLLSAVLHDQWAADEEE
jgi:CRP/FNR family transcriptional regulator, cyclic AMP receptor protein